MQLRFKVVSQPAAPLQARAAKLGWVEGESLWDYVDINDGESEEIFTSRVEAFRAARKASRNCVWGCAQLYEQEGPDSRPRDHEWVDVYMWEVLSAQRHLGKPTNRY